MYSEQATLQSSQENKAESPQTQSSHPDLWFLGTTLGLGLETGNGRCWKLVAYSSITSKLSIYTKF